MNPDEENGVSSSENVKKDLSDWQERHAVLVLSKSKVFFFLFPSILNFDFFFESKRRFSKLC